MLPDDTEHDFRIYIIIGQNEKLGSRTSIFCAFNFEVFVHFQEDAVIVARDEEWSSCAVVVCELGKQKIRSVL